MLDLKAKLASAGLVSQNDIERIEKEKAKKRQKRGTKKGGSERAPSPADDVERVVRSLADKPKAEVYEVVRKWVERVRLDRGGNIPSTTAQTFHFPESTGKVGRLYLEPEVVRAVQNGEAGVVAYMSNHGLAHAVVPAVDARGIASVQPLWLRMLDGDERAGAIDKPPK